MIMYVFDRRWHVKGVKDGTATSAKHPKEVSVDEFIVEDYHTIPTIAVFIVKHAKNMKIDLLRLCGHGNAGELVMGTGLDIATQAHFRKLNNAGVFAPNAVVEIHGCGVASATPLVQDADGHWVGFWQTNGVGHKFVKALARTLGVTVKAAVEGQVADVNYRFEFQYITVAPNGKTTVSGKHS